MANIAVLSGGLADMPCCGTAGLVDPPFPGHYGYHGGGLSGLGQLAALGTSSGTGADTPHQGGFWSFMSGLWDGGPGEVSDWLCALGVGGDRCKPQGGVPGGGTPSAGIGGGTIALIAAAGIAAVLVLRK